MTNIPNIKFNIGEPMKTVFEKEIDIHQDGTTPLYRDVDGKLWAMSGHSHVGHISVFCGTSLDDLEELYPIQTNFCVGHADYAFDKIPYPEGVKSRGSIWPFGLYICPVTHRFFCFFHNETGWAGKGTAYDAMGYCDTPQHDWDFRHVGLMHSDDEGKNWTFDRWVLTAEEVCFTKHFNPGAGNMLGQQDDYFSLGSGDFSTFIDDEYIYIFYNIIRCRISEQRFGRCDAYVARARRRSDGAMGDFVKYYNGSFCEAGNMGKETPIALNSWHPRVLHLKKYGVYLMTSSYADAEKGCIVRHTQLRYSTDLVNWSDVTILTKDGEPFGNHYVAAVSDDVGGQPQVLEGDELSFLTNPNGVRVTRNKARIEQL